MQQSIHYVNPVTHFLQKKNMVDMGILQTTGKNSLKLLHNLSLFTLQFKQNPNKEGKKAETDL